METAPLDIKISESAKLRRASARVRGGVLNIQLPSRWSSEDKQSAVRSLVRRVLAREEKDRRLLEAVLHQATTAGDNPLLSFSSALALERYVHELNAQTLKAPLRKVRMGRARYSRLAQVNLRTGVMTVSQYCLNGVPAAAFRYLIIHELSHFQHGDHSRRFWDLVARFVPDYAFQDKVISAFHWQAVRQAEAEDNTAEPPENEIPLMEAVACASKTNAVSTPRSVGPEVIQQRLF
jgi:predicted metal-dependent hydrolase